MQHLDEGTIHAWLDGELPPDEAARVEAHAASCAACSALVAEARGFVAASSRIVSALDVVPANVVPAFGKKPARRWMTTKVTTAIAATLVIAAGTMVTLRGHVEPTPASAVVSNKTVLLSPKPDSAKASALPAQAAADVTSPSALADRHEAASRVAAKTQSIGAANRAATERQVQAPFA